MVTQNKSQQPWPPKKEYDHSQFNGIMDPGAKKKKFQTIIFL